LVWFPLARDEEGTTIDNKASKQTDF